MNRARIIGLAVAGVAGTSGAAFAGMNVHNEPGSQSGAVAAEMTAAVTTTAVVADGTITYQVGAAGAIEIGRASGSLSVNSAVPGVGWTVVSVSGPGGHVEVVLTDTLQLVTFAADAVGGDIVVSVVNAAAPGVPSTTAAAEPIAVEIVENVGNRGPSTAVPQPATSVPAPRAATTPLNTTTPTTATPTTTRPSTATTAAPSSAGHSDDQVGDDHDSDNDSYNDSDHGDDHEDDHGSDHGGGDDD